jgi:hypothetical protein
MDKRAEARLMSLVKRSNGISEFVDTVIRFLKWYDIPSTWTKKDLRDFYLRHGGKVI